MELTPGLHYDVPWDIYRKYPAANHSTIKLIDRSAAHARDRLYHPLPASDALRIGSAAHCAVLEPERWKVDYAKKPDVDLRTKAGKAAMAALQRDHPGIEILKGVEYDTCERMATSVRDHPAAKKLVFGGKAEVTCIWDDKRTGTRCKGRFDYLIQGKRTIISDLKTTRSAEYKWFTKDAANYGYHSAAAFYRTGLHAVTGKWASHFLLCVEKDPPFATAVYELTEDALEQGDYENQNRMAVFSECLQSGRWPGYSREIEPLHLPDWAMTYARAQR
jgi:hypothetical protein